MIRIAVTGAGGFIGHHLVRRLVEDGRWTPGVDLRHPEYGLARTCAWIEGRVRGELAPDAAGEAAPAAG